MRCKPGVPVMVIRSQMGNEGRVGVVSHWVNRGFETFNGPADVNGWLVKGRFLYDAVEIGEGLFPDEWLKPLDGGEGPDETLAWKEVPLPGAAWPQPDLFPAETAPRPQREFAR